MDELFGDVFINYVQHESIINPSKQTVEMIGSLKIKNLCRVLKIGIIFKSLLL